MWVLFLCLFRPLLSKKGKDPHPQDFRLTKKTSRFTSRANFPDLPFLALFLSLLFGCSKISLIILWFFLGVLCFPCCFFPCCCVCVFFSLLFCVFSFCCCWCAILCVCALFFEGGGLQNMFFFLFLPRFFFWGGVGEGYNKAPPPPIQGVFSKIVNQKPSNYSSCVVCKKKVSPQGPCMAQNARQLFSLCWVQRRRSARLWSSSTCDMHASNRLQISLL